VGVGGSWITEGGGSGRVVAGMGGAGCVGVGGIWIGGVWIEEGGLGVCGLRWRSGFWTGFGEGM
jgi:hypothetical protein